MSNRSYCFSFPIRIYSAPLIMHLMQQIAADAKTDIDEMCKKKVFTKGMIQRAFNELCHTFPYSMYLNLNGKIPLLVSDLRSTSVPDLISFSDIPHLNASYLLTLESQNEEAEHISMFMETVRTLENVSLQLLCPMLFAGLTDSLLDKIMNAYPRMKQTLLHKVDAMPNIFRSLFTDLFRSILTSDFSFKNELRMCHSEGHVPDKLKEYWILSLDTELWAETINTAYTTVYTENNSEEGCVYKCYLGYNNKMVSQIPSWVINRFNNSPYRISSYSTFLKKKNELTDKLLADMRYAIVNNWRDVIEDKRKTGVERRLDV